MYYYHHHHHHHHFYTALSLEHKNGLLDFVKKFGKIPHDISVVLQFGFI